MKKNEIIALATTAIAALIIIMLLSIGALTFDPATLRQPPRPMAELVEMEEEFVDFFDEPLPARNPSSAVAPENVRRTSEPAEASGHDLADAGDAASPQTVVTTEKESPLQTPKKEVPPTTGPSKKELEEEARRRARQGISDAFKASEKAVDNTASKGPEKGASGAPDGEHSAVNGSGSGSVGGGWIMPKYAKVSTSQTGRIELLAIIDDKGKVIKIEQTGGKAPAGADAALVAKCIAEVRRHTFTRTDNDAPPTAKARIVYTFR